MSLALDIRWVAGKLDVIENNECWQSGNLADNFKEAFGKLPPISSPTRNADWQPYVTFLRNWGSHVAVQREFGSRFQQWESALHEDVKENKWFKD